MSVYDLLKQWSVKKYKLITIQDLEDITMGSTILATGGGGDPDIGLLWARRILEDQHEIVLIDPEDVPDDELVAFVGTLGAPLVLTEKPPGGDEVFESLKAISNYLGQKVNAIIPAEAGGVNTIIPLAVAGALGLPVIDADGMGRAFPELHMTSFYIGGAKPSPVAAANEKGHVTIIDSDSGEVSERIIRSAAMAYGGISWTAGYPMNGKLMKKTSIHHTVTAAWEIGKIVRENREKNREPIHEIADFTNGTIAFKGKVVDIARDFGSEMTQGFSSGTISMEGIDDYAGSTAKVYFQNEWLHLTVDGQTLSLPPDLIIIMDPETGEAIRTDIIKYGYRGYILLTPADRKLTTKKGIEVCGPRAFGIDHDYIPYKTLNK